MSLLFLILFLEFVSVYSLNSAEKLLHFFLILYILNLFHCDFVPLNSAKKYGFSIFNSISEICFSVFFSLTWTKKLL